jgi:galactonate dehydratase
MMRMTRRQLLAATVLAAARLRAAADLKITRFATHKATVNGRHVLMLSIHTDGGLTGIGEGSLPARVDIVEQAIRWLEPHLVGRSPAGVEEHWDRMYYGLSRWRDGSVLMTALSAVDIALWDLEGKALGVPVARLLGGPLKRDLRVYYSHWDTPVRPRTPAELARRAVETREKGWTAVKMIPQQDATEAGTIGKLVAELEAIRKAVGDSLDIGLELVERFSTRQAIELARAVAPYKPLFLEEATRRENPHAMRELSEKSPVALAGGEGLLDRQQFRVFLENRGAAIVQPDVIHCGGITEMKRIASLAEVYGAELAPHQWYGPVAHVASVHCASVCRNFLIHEWDGGADPVFQEITGGTMPVQKGGSVRVPAGSGLGITFDPAEFARKYPYRPS